MTIVVGLGNPGRSYEDTRHNVGHRVVSDLAGELGWRFSAGPGDFLAAGGALGGDVVHLILPLSFMNLSGRAVRQALDAVGGTVSDLLVVCDDVNLDLEQIRLRRSGSDGGHNGLASIIEVLSTEEFARLRLGVRRPPPGVEMAEYVLAPFGEEEAPRAAAMVERAVAAARVCLADGIEAAMNQFNRYAAPGEAENSQEGR